MPSSAHPMRTITCIMAVLLHIVTTHGCVLIWLVLTVFTDMAKYLYYIIHHICTLLDHTAMLCHVIYHLYILLRDTNVSTKSVSKPVLL